MAAAGIVRPRSWRSCSDRFRRCARKTRRLFCVFFCSGRENIRFGIGGRHGFRHYNFAPSLGRFAEVLGDCWREGSGWVECKARLLEEYFPYFVRESLVRDLIVFNFQNEGQSMREYIEHVFRAAGFLGYNANKQQEVDRIIMNFRVFWLMLRS